MEYVKREENGKIIYEFDTIIKKVEGIDGAYIEIPFNVEKEFGKKRVPVIATFDDFTYSGIVVKMGTPCHIIGIRKDIRKAINKQPGDIVNVTIKENAK